LSREGRKSVVEERAMSSQAPQPVDKAGDGFRAGFVALVGRPNVGKSTLLNRILGEKIAIATPRPQTTRNRIVGVRNLPGAQLVLVDTPGLHRPSGRGRSRLNQFMVGEALAALQEVDGVCAMVECPSGAEAKKLLLAAERGKLELDAGNKYVIDEVKAANKPCVLALNKVDLLSDKRLLLPLLETFAKAHAWKEMVPISASSGDGVERLVDAMKALLPASQPLFPDDVLTDRAERWIGAEFIREQVFVLTRQEIPYSTAVTIDTWQERAPGKPDAETGSVMVEATIHVEKEAHKPIIVGEGGRMIREIGTRARQEIANLIGVPVHLKLFVRVSAGWTENARTLRELGYGDE
jgi:GTP-binding protein Era